MSDAAAARVQSEFKGDASINDLSAENLAKPLLEEFLNTCDYNVSGLILGSDVSLSLLGISVICILL